MRNVRVIACLDVDRGRVVKGVNFLGLRDAGDPVELARRYDEEGIDELVFLDITASHEQRSTMVEVVARTANELFIPLTVGGGVRAVEDARSLLRAGADKVALNSAALARPALITELSGTFGAQCVVVAIDARKSGSGYGVYTHGGRHLVDKDALTWAIEATERGAGELLVTSMDRDGTELGYDIELISTIATATNVPVVASGGVGKVHHFVEGARAGADGLLAASVFHYGTLSVGEVKKELGAFGIGVRPITA